ncbi:coiled-coil domain-containing protein 57 [Pelobates fuscus]|uniref:coiled-coil domain-containing protein 57 n=1 Tax=Pelobates fuscus TaxID=191477 RepID=UPI002FE4550F
MLPEEAEFAELLTRKEQEWKELQQRQVLYLENSLSESKKLVQEQNEKFNCLKRDFTHNLRVLGERDRELEHYEVMFSRLKVAENAKQSEISDLKVQIEKLQQELQREKRHYDELQGHYQRKLKEHQIEMDRVHSSKNGELDRHREEYEKVKRQLERKIEEVQGDLKLQKQELLLDFDSEMKKREHEFRLQLDEMSTLVLSHELKVKLLTKELAVLREMELKANEMLQGVESSNQALQETLKQKDFEIKDISSVKDARIKELEDKVQSLERKLKREEETFQRKHEQLDRCSREKESALMSMKDAHSEQVQRLEAQIKELQMCIETQEMEQRSLHGRQQGLLAEKDATIEKLKGDIETLKTGWDKYISQTSKESVSKDLHVQSMQEEEEKLKAQVAKYQKDIERYQQQLALSVERERLLEQAKLQTELDWQKRCEGVEKAQYQNSEKLIESLTEAKQQAEAELKENVRQLNELKLLVSALTFERDKAIDMLKRNSAKWERGEQTFAAVSMLELHANFASSEIQKLQEQNSELRHVIGQMRKEMESLCEQIPNSEQTGGVNVQPQGNVQSPDYVKSLEDEIQTLKQNNRGMEEQLQAAMDKKDKIEDSPLAKPVLPENAYIQNYIRGLNETISALRADKVTSAANVRRLEGRAAHLDSMVTELTLKGQQKQAEVDHLQFQLNKETRHSQEAISSLQQRQAALEMQLTEARKEAEEYFKGNLQQSVAAVGLGNEVSALKLELASQRIPVVLSENETVSQLREEILALRQQLDWGKTAGGGSSDLLRSKLKEAAKKISQLSLEKQQLIDMGNRLRAERALAERPAQDPRTPVQSCFSTPPSKLPTQDPSNRLSALENLQYQLTCQELQFAQYQKLPGHPAKHQASVRAKNQGHSEDSGGFAAMQQKENTHPSPPVQGKASASPRPSGSWFEADTSLQDVWKILDMGSSPSLLSSVESSQRVIPGRIKPQSTSQPTANMSINIASSRHPNLQDRSKTSSVVKQVKTKSIHSTPKIRNYNVKD